MNKKVLKYKDILIKVAKLSSYERQGKKFGSGCHIIIPKIFIGQEVLVIPIDG